MLKTYRPGPLGALTDEYEKVLEEFKKVLTKLSDSQFIKINNSNLALDFQSIRNVTAHVVRSGYVYSNYIRKSFAKDCINPEVSFQTIEEAKINIDKMFAYSVATFENKWHLTDDDLMNVSITTSWTTYDLEAICEHAIVHILRHRLQIEKMILKYNL